MPTPTPTRIKAVVPTATPPAQPTPAAPKPPLRDRLARLLPGFNVNSVLLLIVITLLAVMVCKPEPGAKQSRKAPAYSAAPTASAPEYEYWAFQVRRGELEDLRAHQFKNLDYLYGNDHERRGMAIYNVDLKTKWPKGWEYVGPLGSDDRERDWVLIRRPKN